MKMYEKMGIDLTTEEGFKKLLGISCYEIPDESGNPDIPCPESLKNHCVECKGARLFAEVPTKKIKRWEKYEGDFLKARKDFLEFCHSNRCATCKYKDIEENHFCIWLMQEIEVE